MQTIQIENNTKRVINFLSVKGKKTKKVGDVIKELKLDKIGNSQNNLSISHDNILYK